MKCGRQRRDFAADAHGAGLAAGSVAGRKAGASARRLFNKQTVTEPNLNLML